MATSAALAAVPVSAGHASVVAPGLLGGGALLAGGKDGSGNMLIGLRVTPDDRVRLNVSLQISCPGGDDTYIDVNLAVAAVIAPDATFSAAGTRVERYGTSQTQTAYAIAGAFTATGASGTATVSVTDDDPVLPTCGSASFTSGSVAWQARRPAAIGARGAPAGAVLYGATSQRIRGAVGAFVVRVSPDGKRLSRVMFQLRESCSRRVITPNFTLKTGDDYFSVQLRTPIRRNGTFVEQARATSTDNGVTLRYLMRLAGTIGATGARGTYRSNRSLVTKRTGRLRERCATTTPIRWTAAP